jgi:hypothetical protein
LALRSTRAIITRLLSLFQERTLTRKVLSLLTDTLRKPSALPLRHSLFEDDHREIVRVVLAAAHEEIFEHLASFAIAHLQT